MCLTIDKNQERSIAETDITVYKVVHNDDYSIPNKGCYQTLYRDADVMLGCTYKSELIKEYSLDDHMPTNAVVNIGIHSFGSLLDAMRDGRSVTNKYYIIRCTIPKGSMYYKGSFFEATSYASDTLQYDELLLSAYEILSVDGNRGIEWKDTSGNVINDIKSEKCNFGNNYEAIAIKAGLIKK